LIPNLGYAYSQGYEPGHLRGTRKKENNGGIHCIFSFECKYIHALSVPLIIPLFLIPLLVYLITVTIHKFVITATTLQTFYEYEGYNLWKLAPKGYASERKQVGNHWSTFYQIPYMFLLSKAHNYVNFVLIFMWLFENGP
jgi:hypothetical protein